MSRILEQFNADHERVLDKLVDGELSEIERRELLSALDDEPSGWRRCALAFLEAQTWRGDFRAVCKPEVEAAAVNGIKVEAAKPQAWNLGRIAEICLAMAASLLIAFSTGMWVRGAWHPRAAAEPSAPIATQMRDRPSVAANTPRDVPVQMVKLNVDDPAGDSPTGIELPVVESSNLNEDWLRNQRSAVPADMVRSLERAGHRVTQQQQYWPVDMQDGRRLIVPVEQVDIVPQVRPAY